MLKFVVILSWLLQYFPKKKGYFIPKIEGMKKIVKIRFRLFYEEKKTVPMANKPEGGGGGWGGAEWPGH